MKPSFFYILKQKFAGKNFLYEFYFKNKRTLDVGCGEGKFLSYDKKLIAGIDTNVSCVERLKKEGYQVALASVEEIPFADNSFAAVQSHNVIEHLPVTLAYAMIKEAARVLSRDGIFVLSSEVPTKNFWNTFGHVKPYPPAAIKKLLRAESREEFEPISSLEIEGVFYLGNYHKNKFLYLLSAFFGYYTPFCRREYFLVLRKK